MLDFGWQEFLVIGVVAVLVVGPKELPRVFRTVSGLMRKARSLAGEFHSAMDDMAREADLQDIKNEVTKAKSGSSDWVKDIDPTGEVSKSMKDAKEQVSSAKDSINKSARPNFPDKTPSPSTSSPSTTTPKPDVKPDDAPATGSKATSETSADANSAKASPAKASPAKASPANTPKKAASKKAAAKGTAKAAAKKTAAKATPAKKSAGTKTAAKKAAAKKTGDTA